MPRGRKGGKRPADVAGSAIHVIQMTRVSSLQPPETIYLHLEVMPKYHLVVGPR
jgi:hypothetical protein